MSDRHQADPQLVDEPIITQAWVVDESGAQLLVADFIDWSLIVFQDSRSEPILYLTGQDITEVLVDVPVAWDINARGYNFAHSIAYLADYDGQIFAPVVGSPVHLEYRLNRTNGRGPRCIFKDQPLIDSVGANAT